MTLAALAAGVIVGGVVATAAVHAAVMGDDKVFPICDDMAI